MAKPNRPPRLGMTDYERARHDSHDLLTRYTPADTRAHVDAIDAMLLNAMTTDQVVRGCLKLAAEGKIPKITKGRVLTLIARIEEQFIRDVSRRHSHYKANAIRGTMDMIRRAKTGVTKKRALPDGTVEEVVVQKPSFLAEAAARDQYHKMIGAYAPVEVNVHTRDAELAAQVLAAISDARFEALRELGASETPAEGPVLLPAGK